MGIIEIKMFGSFPTNGMRSCAEEGGHAFAIHRAIEFLSSRLPDAIVLDHKLHDSGDRPPKSDFGKPQWLPPASPTTKPDERGEGEHGRL